MTSPLLPRIRKTLADTRGSDTENGPLARLILYIVADHLEGAGEGVPEDERDFYRAIAQEIREEAEGDWSR